VSRSDAYSWWCFSWSRIAFAAWLDQRGITHHAKRKLQQTAPS
jgi:hypothetical protein